jgi:hypothetical protein
MVAGAHVKISLREPLIGEDHVLFHVCLVELGTSAQGHLFFLVSLS